jgi:hypothetical protein
MDEFCHRRSELGMRNRFGMHGDLDNTPA